MTPKLIAGLSTLSKPQWTSFRKYLLMHTSEKAEVIECFSLLHRKQSQLENFDAQVWRKKYMPHFSEKTWLNMLSKLFLWLEEWIVYSNLQNDKIRSGVELVQHWNRVGRYKLADSKAKAVQAKIDQYQVYSPQNYYHQYQLYYYQFFSDNPIKYTDPTLLSKLIRSYLVYNQYKMSLYKTQLTFWNNIRNLDDVEYQGLMKELVVSNADPIIIHLLRMIQHNDVESFHYCYQAVKNADINPSDDFAVLLTMYLINYAQKLWHMQRLDSPDYLVEMYEIALANEVLMRAGKIPEIRYMTMISVLGSARPLAWTNDFIDTWTAKVDTTDVERLKLFVKANNYFQHGHLLESLELLQLMSTKQINARAYIHKLSIKLYYETRAENYEQLTSSLERYRIFLWRRKGKISPSNYNKGQNFLKNMKLLIQSEEFSIEMPKYTPSNETKWLTSKSKKKMSQVRGPDSF